MLAWLSLHGALFTLQRLPVHLSPRKIHLPGPKRGFAVSGTHICTPPAREAPASSVAGTTLISSGLHLPSSLHAPVGTPMSSSKSSRHAAISEGFSASHRHSARDSALPRRAALRSSSVNGAMDASLAGDDVVDTAGSPLRHSAISPAFSASTMHSRTSSGTATASTGCARCSAELVGLCRRLVTRSAPTNPVDTRRSLPSIVRKRDEMPPSGRRRYLYL
mmetsp:Transcript_49190/g.105043  ORF Transcript_49190/g.105043 Transcript_49190/m.105043 type:complete len:220 (-) Transcript_49190:3-662(-)